MSHECQLARVLVPRVLRPRIRGRVDVAMTAPDCDVTDCGTARCDRCDERLSCLGPEPRACGVTCADCPCDCTLCLRQREDMRDELLNQLEREAR